MSFWWWCARGRGSLSCQLRDAFSPQGHNDDWYWLYAAMASGKDCKVVSNDEMRDHHFGMLAPRAFVRWKEQHVVHFAFKKQGSEQAVPSISLPPVYSRQIQTQAGAWHFPCSESSRWLCVWHSSMPPTAGMPESSVSALAATGSEADACDPLDGARGQVEEREADSYG